MIRTVVLWALAALVLVVLFAALQPSGAAHREPELAYNVFLDRVGSGEIASVTTEHETIYARAKDGREYVVYAPYQTMPDTVRELRNAGVEIHAERPRTGPTLGDFVLSVLPMLLLIGAWFVFMQQMRKKGAQGPGAGNSGQT